MLHPRPRRLEAQQGGMELCCIAAFAVLDLRRASAHIDGLDPQSLALLLSQAGPCSAQVFTMRAGVLHAWRGVGARVCREAPRAMTAGF